MQMLIGTVKGTSPFYYDTNVCSVVDFEAAEDVANALRKLDSQELKGQRVKLHEDPVRQSWLQNSQFPRKLLLLVPHAIGLAVRVEEDITVAAAAAVMMLTVVLPHHHHATRMGTVIDHLRVTLLESQGIMHRHPEGMITPRAMEERSTRLVTPERNFPLGGLAQSMRTVVGGLRNLVRNIVGIDSTIIRVPFM
jgi:hypothetical protein